MTKIKSINSNQLCIAQNAEVSLKLAGNTAQVTFTAGKSKKCPIKMGPAAKVILGTVLGAQSLYTAGVAGINLYNSASKIADGLLNGDMSWLDAFCEGSMALNSAAGIYYSLKGLLGGCELALKGLDDVAANYAAKQEAWYKEHAGYTTNNLDNIQESGASVMPQSVADARNNMNYTPQTVNKGGRKTDFYVTPSGEAVPATGY